jgi:hypothetical protein
MPKKNMILYFNHQYLDNTEIQYLLQDIDQTLFETLLNFDRYERAAGGFYSRKGSNFLPTQYNIKNLPGFSMPDYDPNYNKSWAEVSDQRCQDLRKTHFDRPWTVMWSGGIDSTGIMAAIIKNLPKSDFENITVACSMLSIWENPQFYVDYIKPNFKVVSSEWATSKDAIEKENYIISGEIADKMFGGGSSGVATPNLIDQPGVLGKNIRIHKDHAVDFLAVRTNKKFAEWYYTVLVNNAASVGITLTTLHDLIWWSSFNNAWTSSKFEFLNYGHWQNIKNLGVYFDRSVYWFDSPDYQSWAMSNHSLNLIVHQTAAKYKLDAKKYIYSVDQNEYYYKFKTKMSSGDISYRNKKISPWCCIDQDLNLLNLTDNKDQILQLLPSHFRTIQI